MRKTLLICCILPFYNHYLCSNGPPPEKPSPQPPVVTPHAPREAPSIRHNPGHR